MQVVWAPKDTDGNLRAQVWMVTVTVLINQSVGPHSSFEDGAQSVPILGTASGAWSFSRVASIPTHPYMSLHVPARPYTSLHVPTHPYMSLHIPARPNTSLCIPTHPYTSLHIPTHPYTSLHVPTRPYMSLHIPARPCTHYSKKSAGIRARKLSS